MGPAIKCGFEALTKHDFIIRTYAADDFSDIQHIYALCKPDEFAHEAVKIKTRALTDDPMRLAQFTNSDVYVMEMHKSIAGFITVSNQEIGWLYVHPECRRLGLGRALLAHVMTLSQGRALTLNIVKSNRPALGLYLKYQFKVVDEFVAQVNGQPVEVLEMSW
ncbi:GNAT family N-acetyltransferase [Photobacterium atrarenae]|uniref:GNAT family N-acetyltransferase n=1 Tax=Photobacterium atrarenae TaxID=865757 RepID=A0ABY5GDB7_9GAMM|nr:GNAT family N-acetyltransferase [Photobacterium atrarenae]UTV26592.1 GNAT family N-acetyltransferase [Photobacterium atrarenae]